MIKNKSQCTGFSTETPQCPYCKEFSSNGMYDLASFQRLNIEDYAKMIDRGWTRQEIDTKNNILTCWRHRFYYYVGGILRPFGRKKEKH